MDPSQEASGVGLDNAGPIFSELETTGLSHLETGFLELRHGTDGHVSGEIIDLEEPTENNLFGVTANDADYSPSIMTDFSGFCLEFQRTKA